jgi:hypothetical protein
MSEEELKNLPSIQGYVNLDELKQALLRGFGQASLMGFASYVVIIVGESAHLWYTGPAAATVVSILTMIAAYLRSSKIGIKLLKEGE